MVSFVANVVPFQLNNATGNQSIADPNGPGLAPKAAIFVCSGATSLDTPIDQARASIGITDGTTHLVTGYMAESGSLAASADTGRRVDNATVINMCTTANQALDYEGTWVSFDTDGITISNSAARQFRGFVILFYGDDLSAAVSSLASSSSIGGTASITGLSFAPDCAIVISALSAFAADTGLNNMIQSFGFAGRLPSTTQACFGAACTDLASPTAVAEVVRNDALLVRITSALAMAGWVELTSWNSDGITVTTRDTAVAMTGGYLLMRVGGMKCMAAVPNLESDSTGMKSYTGFGFRGRLLMVLGAHVTAVNTLDATTSAHSIGAASERSGDAVVSWNDRDNLSTSDSQSEAAAVLISPVTGIAPTYAWRAEFTAMTGTGFQYTVGNTHASQLPTPVFVIGEGFAPGWIDARPGHRWRRCLARR